MSCVRVQVELAPSAGGLLVLALVTSLICLQHTPYNTSESGGERSDGGRGATVEEYATRRHKSLSLRVIRELKQLNYSHKNNKNQYIRSLTRRG